MPGRNGEEVLRELKSDPATRGIPVIVISVKEATEAPADTVAHLVKPVRPETCCWMPWPGT